MLICIAVYFLADDTVTSDYIVSIYLSLIEIICETIGYAVNDSNGSAPKKKTFSLNTTVIRF